MTNNNSKVFNLIFALVLAFSLCFSVVISPIHVDAADPSVSDIQINDVYVLPDNSGFLTYYVVYATNNTGADVSVETFFTAFGKDGEQIYKVSDYVDAVRNGQDFITYGQFSNNDIENVSKFDYEIQISETSNCTYSSVDVEANKADDFLIVEATNYSEHDLQGVNVRTLFLRNGKPIAFDYVNIADAGTTFHGGSTNCQVIGFNIGSYNDFILTYTSAGSTSEIDY